MGYQFELPQAEWEELKVARMTYPQLKSEDQGTWLGLERVTYQIGLLHGYFTFRVESNKFGPNLDGHIANGKSHVLAPMLIKKGLNGRDKIATLFLVDLRKASMRLHLAKKRMNSHGEEYLLFDSMVDGVSAFAERLRVS